MVCHLYQRDHLYVVVVLLNSLLYQYLLILAVQNNIIAVATML